MQQLEAKLQPQRIRATLSFAGLYQISHEMIKQFYWGCCAHGVPIPLHKTRCAHLITVTVTARSKMRKPHPVAMVVW